MTSNDPWHKARQSKILKPPGRNQNGTVRPHDVLTPKLYSQHEQRNRELRLFGLNACLAVFTHRPQAIRKIYLVEALIPRFRHVLSWCAENRIGYRLVDQQDLVKLTQSDHHEGVCFEVLNSEPLSLGALLKALREKPRSWLVWLDGIGNPHNFGAILRSAAHFACDGLMMPMHSALTLSGAACRVAEGGAEAVPITIINDAHNALAQLKQQGYSSIATVTHEGDDLFKTQLPPKVVLLIGAESHGISPDLIAACDQRLAIPGSGAVDSLNVSAAFAIFAAQITRP